MADITPARKLFDLLVSRDFDPEMLDSSGKPAPDPAEAEIFSFDFRAHSGKDYGTVVIMLGDDNDLEVYCSDNVGRSMEGTDKNDWFAFLEQLKNFSVRNFMTFGIKNLNRLRYSMQGQAAIKEGLFESWTGNRTTSWNGDPTEARLMIRHKKNISEGDARFRYIESLFIETADSERYKLPFKSLTGGRAMLEHVRHGGRPYDARGNHISEMVTELAVLSRFRRANQGQIFEGDTQQLVEQVQEYQAKLQRGLKGIGTQTGYTKYFESWSPAEISEQDVVIESLKSLFVKQSIDTRIESALPLLAKIQQQGTAMKEANIFEAWAERLTEGTWQLPDTPEKQAQLLELMSTDLPVGADATNVTEQLYDLLGDDELFDQLEALAEQDANADARQVIFDRMQMLSDHPDVLKVIEQLNIDPTAEMNPAEPTNPSDLEPMNESRMLDESGETIDHILNRFKHEVRNFEQSGEMADDLYHALFDYWNDAGEIPYGIQKARDGDPYEWVAQNLQSHLSGGGVVGGNPDEDYGIERESVMHGDYAEEKSRMRKLAGLPQETDEGLLGILGGLAGGALTGNDMGADAGAGIGNALGNALDETNVDENKEGTAGQIIKKLLDPIAQGLAGGGSKSLSIPLVGEEETEGGSGIIENNPVTLSNYDDDHQYPDRKPEGLSALGAVKSIGQGIKDALVGEDGMEEGWKGQLAGGTAGTLAGMAAGAASPIPFGAAIGGALGGTAGQMIGDKLGGEETTESSPLAGQYGHSGKMKEVSKDTSFLDRLKELSGMNRK
jgi:hypothetical protein